MTPTGVEHPGLRLAFFVQWLLRICGIKTDVVPLSRNAIIRARHAAGETLTDLAHEFGISPQRVWQIVQFSP